MSELLPYDPADKCGLQEICAKGYPGKNPAGEIVCYIAGCKFDTRKSDAPKPHPKKKMTRKQRHDIAIKNFENIITPEVLEEAERLHKQMGRISPEELYREFTI